jgi:hypothetical protein
MQAMRVSTPENRETGEFSATWILLSDNTEFFTLPAVAGHVRAPDENPRVHLWTDDYSSLLPLIH